MVKAPVVDDPALVQEVPLPQPFRRISKILSSIIDSAFEIGNASTTAQSAERDADEKDLNLPSVAPSAPSNNNDINSSNAIEAINTTDVNDISKTDISKTDINKKLNVSESDENGDARLEARCACGASCVGVSLGLGRLWVASGIAGAPCEESHRAKHGFTYENDAAGSPGAQQEEQGRSKGRGSSAAKSGSGKGAKSQPRPPEEEAGAPGDKGAESAPWGDLASWSIPGAFLLAPGIDRDAAETGDRGAGDDAGKHRLVPKGLFVSCSRCCAGDSPAAGDRENAGGAGSADDAVAHASAAITVAVSVGESDRSGEDGRGAGVAERVAVAVIAGRVRAVGAEVRLGTSISWVSSPVDAPADPVIERPARAVSDADDGDDDPRGKPRGGARGSKRQAAPAAGARDKKAAPRGKAAAGRKGGAAAAAGGDEDGGEDDVALAAVDPDAMDTAAYLDYDAIERSAPARVPGRATAVLLHGAPSSAPHAPEILVWWENCARAVRVAPARRAAAKLASRSRDAAARAVASARDAGETREDGDAVAAAAAAANSSSAAGAKRGKRGGGGGGGKAGPAVDDASAASDAAAQAVSAEGTLAGSDAADTLFGARTTWTLPECLTASCVDPAGLAAAVGGRGGSLWVYDARSVSLRPLHRRGGVSSTALIGRKSVRGGAGGDQVVRVVFSAGGRVVAIHESGTVAAHDLAAGSVATANCLAGRSIGDVVPVGADTVAVVVDAWDVRIVDVSLAPPALAGRVTRAGEKRKGARAAAAAKGRSARGSRDPRVAPEGHIATRLVREGSDLVIVDTSRDRLGDGEVAERTKARLARRLVVAREAEAAALREMDAAGGAGRKGGKRSADADKKGGGGKKRGGDGQQSADPGSAEDAAAALGREVASAEAALRAAVPTDQDIFQVRTRITARFPCSDLVASFPRPAEGDDPDAPPVVPATFSFSATPGAISGSVGGPRRVAEGPKDTQRAARNRLQELERIRETRRAAEAESARRAEAQRARDEAVARDHARRQQREHPLATPLWCETAREETERLDAEASALLQAVLDRRLAVRNHLREGAGLYAMDPSEEGSAVMSIARV